MFPPPSAYYPGHPSYPSAHSTNACAVALLCAELVPAKKNDLLTAADGIARNREIAGLHYRSDSLAGVELATALIALFLKDTEVATRITAAKAEW